MSSSSSSPSSTKRSASVVRRTGSKIINRFKRRSLTPQGSTPQDPQQTEQQYRDDLIAKGKKPSRLSLLSNPSTHSLGSDNSTESVKATVASTFDFSLSQSQTGSRGSSVRKASGVSGTSSISSREKRIEEGESQKDREPTKVVPAEGTETVSLASAGSAEKSTGKSTGNSAGNGTVEVPEKRTVSQITEPESAVPTGVPVPEPSSVPVSSVPVSSVPVSSVPMSSVPVSSVPVSSVPVSSVPEPSSSIPESQAPQAQPVPVRPSQLPEMKTVEIEDTAVINHHSSLHRHPNPHSPHSHTHHHHAHTHVGNGSRHGSPLHERQDSYERFQHSYDHRFSSTSISRLNTRAPPLVRTKTDTLLTQVVETFVVPNRSQSSQNVKNADTPFMYRTASRVWGEVQESKGQSWLEARQDSTRMDSDSDSDDGLTFSIGTIGIRREVSEGQHDDDFDENEVFKRGRMMTFVDWLLGLEPEKSLAQPLNPGKSQRKSLSPNERIALRDDENDGSIDAAWYLGVISTLF